MTPVVVRIHVDASPAAVWDDLRDLASHVEWMADAVEIRFATERTSGVGTAFECDTRVGPLHLTDVMEITEWKPERTMGVHHTGVVTGTGTFTLTPSARGGTIVTWSEALRFPWWLAGSVGEAVGAPILRRIWTGNLTRLKRRIERDGSVRGD